MNENIKIDINNNNSKPKKKRIFYFDLIRAFAIVLVVMIHVCNAFMKANPVGTFGWIVPSLTKGFSTIAVPLFLMISGALLLNRNYELKDYISHRFIRLILPVIFWGIIFILLKLYVGGYTFNITSIYEMILWFLNEGYWFSWMMISLYLFVPIINSFIKEYSFKGIEYFLGIWVIYLILFSFDRYPLGQLDLSYFAGYIGFFVLGYYINNKDFKLSYKTMYLTGLLICLIFFAVNAYLRISCLYQGVLVERVGFLAVLQASGMFLFIKYFAIYSENNSKSVSNKIYSLFKDTVLGKIIFSISICSYGIYLTHYYFLHIGFGWIQKNILNIYSLNPIITMPIILIKVVLLSWFLVLIISKIPYLKKWTGIG